MMYLYFFYIKLYHKIKYSLVKVENNRLILFLFLDLGLKVSIMSQNVTSHCHIITYHIKECKRFQNNDCQDRRRWTWLILFFFSFSIFFWFYFSIFLFLEQLGLGLISHAITSVTWWQSHKTDHETWENLVEDSRTNNVMQYEHHMLTSWTTHGCLG